jgi:hypothetical protein
VAKPPIDDSLNHPPLPAGRAVRVTNSGAHEETITQQNFESNNSKQKFTFLESKLDK